MIRRPWELIAEAAARSPQFLIKPHMEGLGLEWNEETKGWQRKLLADGTPDPGATHIGFSREGVARRSRHKDIALQAKLAEQLNDRLYGKARMALDVEANSTVMMPQIPQTMERALDVARVLKECNALPGEDHPGDDEDDEVAA